MDRLLELLEEDQNNELNRRARSSMGMDEEDEIEVFAFSIQEALQSAADELGTSIANLQYEILEKGNPGFMGFGKKPSKILIKRSGNLSMNAMGAEGDDDMDIFVPNSNIVIDQNGTFKLQVKKFGVMLKVSPPKGNGLPISMAPIQAKLAEKQITNFSPVALQKAVEHANDKWEKIGEYVASPYDSTFQIQISPDEMKAFIVIIKPEKYGRVLDPQEVVQGLKGRNVFFGIKEEAIKNAIENEIYNMPVLVAEGEPPLEGRDAEIKYHFKTSTDDIKFAIAEDGSVDFHKLDIVQSVVVGQVLATKIPLERGKAGKTVSGRVIPARDGREVRLMPGKNAKISPDGSQIVSEINGQVVFKNGKINVEEVLAIEGDVDLNTGDINFPGNIVINGNINDTFKVFSGGNIEVRGNIGKAEVVAEGNIVVRAGIQGKDEARITCGGDIYAKFIERAQLQIEGDIFIPEVLLHSKVQCKGNIICSGGRRSQIAGGHIRALKEINAKYLGAESYVETIIEAGSDAEAEDKLVEANRRKEELTKELPEITKQLNNLSMLMAGGPLPPNKEELFNTLSVKNTEIRQEVTALEEQIEQIHEYLENLGEEAKISASKITYPGVKVKIKSAILVVKSDYEFVTFRKEGPNVKIVPYEKPKELEEKANEIKKRKRRV